MILQPYDYFLIAWFILAGLSTAYVAVDQSVNNPEPSAMRWGFPGRLGSGFVLFDLRLGGRF